MSKRSTFKPLLALDELGRRSRGKSAASSTESSAGDEDGDERPPQRSAAHASSTSTTTVAGVSSTFVIDGARENHKTHVTHDDEEDGDASSLDERTMERIRQQAAANVDVAKAIKDARRERIERHGSAYKHGNDAPRHKQRSADKRVRTALERVRRDEREAVAAAVDAEVLHTVEAGFLEADGPMERTKDITQAQLRGLVHEQMRKRMFDIELPRHAPYAIDYTRNGRHVLLGGQRGHIALMDVLDEKLLTQVHIKDAVRDVKFLHNHMYLAAAQSDFVHIYDQDGIEIHCMKEHYDVLKMDFLPYHFLLTTIGQKGFLLYHDVSTGELVADHRTALGPCDVMAQNPSNAVIHLGHGNGSVTLWTPNSKEPVVRMFCNRGAVRALCVDDSGHYMATAGRDMQVRVWDLRMYKETHSYFTPRPASALSVSQRGVLAAAHGGSVFMWRDGLRAKSSDLYMQHRMQSKAIKQIAFMPYDDALGIGHSSGFSSICVPGAGEPNFDSFVANPYASKKARQEQEVRQLLDKLQPDMIALDPNFVGGVVHRKRALLLQQRLRLERRRNREHGNDAAALHDAEESRSRTESSEGDNDDDNGDDDDDDDDDNGEDSDDPTRIGKLKLTFKKKTRAAAREKLKRKIRADKIRGAVTERMYGKKKEYDSDSADEGDTDGGGELDTSGANDAVHAAQSRRRPPSAAASSGAAAAAGQSAALARFSKKQRR